MRAVKWKQEVGELTDATEKVADECRDAFRYKDLDFRSTKTRMAGQQHMAVEVVVSQTHFPISSNISPYQH